MQSSSLILLAKVFLWDPKKTFLFIQCLPGSYFIAWCPLEANMLIHVSKGAFMTTSLTTCIDVFQQVTSFNRDYQITFAYFGGSNSQQIYLEFEGFP